MAPLARVDELRLRAVANKEQSMKPTVVLAGACLLFAGQALAQTPSPPPASPSPAPQTQAAGVPSTQDFVNNAAIGGLFEVQSSELALQKHPDRSMKPFANRMIKDHTAMNKQLKSLVSKDRVNVELPTALDADHQKMLDDLRGLNGKQFDEAYDKDQLQGHEQAVDLFRQYSQNGDNGGLKRWAAKTLPHLEQHLAMAEKLK
jgi:putative membrane protein